MLTQEACRRGPEMRLDARQRFGLDRPEFGEIDRRDFRQARAARTAAADAPPASAALTSSRGDAALFAGAVNCREIEVEFAREAADRGAGD